MFYRKEEVDSAMLCSICSDVFQDADPRILPCGDSACNKCIEESTNSQNEFNCSPCHQKHIPLRKEGFPVNKAILKLFKAKADQVYRNRDVETFRSKLADLKKKTDELQAN